MRESLAYRLNGSKRFAFLVRALMEVNKGVTTMSRPKTALVIAVLWSLAPLAMCQAEESTSTSESSYRLAMKLIREAPESTRLDDLLLYRVLTGIGTERETAEPPSDSIRVFLDELVDDPMNHPNIRRAALRSLRIFEPDQELEHMRGFLDDPDFQLTAAEILVEWGYWDEGSPLLIKNEVYEPLVRNSPVQAEPILREAMISASPYGRIQAAYLVSEFGDTIAMLHTARDLVQQYVTSGQQYPDTMNIRVALRTAYDILREQHDPNDLTLFEAGLSHFSPSVRETAFTAILAWAREGDSRAISAMKSAAESNKYPHIRELAEYYLERLEQQDR